MADTLSRQPPEIEAEIIRLAMELRGKGIAQVWHIDREGVEIWITWEGERK